MKKLFPSVLGMSMYLKKILMCVYLTPVKDYLKRGMKAKTRTVILAAVIQLYGAGGGGRGGIDRKLTVKPGCHILYTEGGGLPGCVSF